MDKYALIIILILLSGLTSAYTLTVEVKDLNSKVGVNNVSLSLRNESDTLTGYTNADGLKAFNINNNTHYIDVVKTGYFSQLNKSLGVLEVDTYLVYFITPISESGIVRIPISDITGVKHAFCVYYAENNRLDQCYDSNNTVVNLIVNKEYIFKPKITAGDIPSSIKNISFFGGYYIRMLYGVIIIFGFLILFISIFIYFIKRKPR